ncbi:hypothetical protein L226DRAFT_533801 [Lentinus tigrinus ALCF2SS1-7]|uniref:EthD domain-containing protein n=1 Tax=Lentinus tigrinus ALCF2SS1-6 TaxID=1328759 RepID=A0A5C2SB24_9APHY|nr:hypothetical protein L227DRAFT_575094 [Lentinus tigrinus ALCF2SS1-6]RPD75720.1 hypothetical protein L226DRAFT_533801 [Lentinus tigrinus ALCF2SS1-7]
MSGLLVVLSEPGPTIPEAEFNDWYDTEHVPDRILLPCFHSWSRWTSTDASPPTHLALYDLDKPESLDDPAHVALIQNPSPREASIMSRIALLDIRAYELHEPVHPPRAGYEVTKPGEYASVAEFDVPAELEDEFNRWYDEEHIPMVTKIPQWARSRRFVLKVVRVLGTEEELVSKYGEGRVAKYLTIHEYTDAHAGETVEFKAALNTPWTKEMLGKVSRFERRVWRFSSSWERS